MLSLFLSLGLLALSFYLMPYLLFHWQYDLPQFVLESTLWVQTAYGYSEMLAERYVFLVLFGLAMLCVFIAVYASNTIDGQLLHVKPSDKVLEPRVSLPRKESTLLFFKIIILIGSVFVLAALIEWLISISS